MSVPEHLWRFPTREAQGRLARRFELPDDPRMQDWEWQVADARRIDEFLSAYEQPELSDDERFSLMEILIQSFDDLASQTRLDVEPRWQRVLVLLEERIELHVHTVWYWACVDEEDDGTFWEVSPDLRKLLARHRGRLESPARRPS